MSRLMCEALLIACQPLQSAVHRISVVACSSSSAASIKRHTESARHSAALSAALGPFARRPLELSLHPLRLQQLQHTTRLHVHSLTALHYLVAPR